MVHPVLARGRYRGNVVAGGLVLFCALRVHGGFECFEHDRACLGRQPGANDEQATVVVVKVQSSR